MEAPQESEQKKPATKTDYAGGWGIVLLEVAWIFVVHNFYPVFSIWAFGTGTGSFLYSTDNLNIYLGLVLLPPTLLNVARFIIRRKARLPTARFIVAQVIVIILFIAILQGSVSWDF
ncbi:MAG: hypothetical protein EOO45_20605 [Flavobacterium sp.]|nr:MAG: hypothetical protein EOO45_20605 [Flavobacterium sp.]